MKHSQNIYELFETSGMHPLLEEQTVPYRVLGGIAAHAMMGAETIDWPSKSIEIPQSYALPSIRENGTRRDIDMLVMSSDKTVGGQAKDVLHQSLNDSLAISVFGLLPREPHQKKRLARRLDVVSHRLVDTYGNYSIQLDDIETPLPPNYYDAWSVRFSGQASPLFTTISPASIVAAYRTRSITGVRPKDKSKIEKLTGVITASIDSLTDGASETYARQEAAGLEHAQALGARRSVPGWFRRKASALHQLERHPQAVELVQGGLERVLGPLLGKS